MQEVAVDGFPAAKHLRGNLYEIRGDAPTRSFRLLFSAEGRFKQVLLSLSAFSIKTQKTPVRELELAERPLRDWARLRGVVEAGKATRSRLKGGCGFRAIGRTLWRGRYLLEHGQRLSR